MKLFVLLFSVNLVLGDIRPLSPPYIPVDLIPEWQEAHPGYMNVLKLNEEETPRIESRIVGGSEAAAHQFPYQVGVISHLLSGINGWCGGSLVSVNFVLTAAHCVDL